MKVVLSDVNLVMTETLFFIMPLLCEKINDSIMMNAFCASLTLKILAGGRGILLYRPYG